MMTNKIVAVNETNVTVNLLSLILHDRFSTDVDDLLMHFDEDSSTL
jgi:hypothetical protein